MIPEIKKNYQISIWSLTLGGVALFASVFWYNIITHEAESSIRLFLYGLPLALIIFGLACLEQMGNKNVFMSVITHPMLVALGNTSYVVYLIHNVILRVWDGLIPITAVQEPLIIIIVLLVSTFVYRFWEKPVLHYFRVKTLKTENNVPAVEPL